MECEHLTFAWQRLERQTFPCLTKLGPGRMSKTACQKQVSIFVGLFGLKIRLVRRGSQTRRVAREVVAGEWLAGGGPGSAQRAFRLGPGGGDLPLGQGAAFGPREPEICTIWGMGK